MSLELKDQYDKVYRYCYFKLKNAHLAEDLTQETFLRFFSQNSYINRGKPLAYLYTIAKNLCLDSFKKAKASSLDDINEEAGASDLDANITVNQAVRTLPKDLQEIILLRYTNELSVSEIGGIVGLSRFAVHRKINKALDILKLSLRKEDFRG